jgi:hypothetical protein
LNIPHEEQGTPLSLSIFVNTSDGFSDCWPPFFKLFERYGGVLRRSPIYLNTERASFDWPGLDIRCTKVWPAGVSGPLNWSECFTAGLDVVTGPYVFYLQEDYFLDRPVRDEVIAEALLKLQGDETIGVVYLNEQGPKYRTSRPYENGFREILPPARYLVNTQAAIWRKDFLLSLIKPWENGWMFEKFGSVRARKAQQRFVTVSPEVMADGSVIDHVHTGIARGKWQVECLPLFEKEGIMVDFSRRGFYRRGSRMKFRLEVLRKLFGRPVPALRSILSLVQSR